MANTITVSDVMGWARTFYGYNKLNIGTGNEPAITAANVVIQTMLGPPFKWNWNRDSLNFNVSEGIQDYTVAAATFGFVEKAAYTDQAL